MNAIGIDYQRTLTVICLREGSCSVAKIRSVGDGQCHLIPNVVLDDELWGSRALQSGDGRRLWSNDELDDSSWLDEGGTALFWRGVYRRLYAYLGRTEPTIPNGYRTIVSIQAEYYNDVAERITRFCKAAGFDNTAIISAVDAVFCRWLAEQKENRSRVHVVAAVAVGDTSISVRAYRVQQQSHDYPRILAASQTLVLNGVGQAWWVNKVLELLEKHVNGLLPTGQVLGLRNAAISLGEQLDRIAPHEFATWTGPFQSLLFEPLQLTLEECASWGDVVQKTYNLPTTLRKVVSSIANSREPDILLLGGIGVVWPFARNAITPYIEAKDIWQSDSPQEDVAWGAACFPEVGEPYTDILQGITESPPERPLAGKGDASSVLVTPFPDTQVRETPFQSSPWASNEVSLDINPQIDLPLSISITATGSNYQPSSLYSEEVILGSHPQPTPILPGNPTIDFHLEPASLHCDEVNPDPEPEAGSLFSAGVKLDPRLQPDPLFPVPNEIIRDLHTQVDPLVIEGAEDAMPP